MNSAGSSLLLLSGAGLPAWIWDPFLERLDPGTRAIVAPRPAAAGATLRDYAETALAQVPEGRFTLIAHSSGGVVAAAVAALQPSRIVGVLGVSAVVPTPGRTFLRALPAPQRWVIDTAIRFMGTHPPDSMIRKGVAAGVAPEVADRIVREFTPESIHLYRDRAPGATYDGPRGYVVTERDKELAPALQERFAVTLGATWREGLPTKHLPMLEAPEAFAAAVAHFRAFAED